jgi:methionyl-tRNA synthetase
MYQNSWDGPWDFMGMDPVFFMGLFPLLMVWSLAWKGWALYLAARRGEIVWFIVLLLVNTVGLLEIFYIFAIAKQSDTKVEKKPEEKKSEETVSQ